MADLFTRLVSGPASLAWLSPRVPTVHEPTVSSDVDETEVVEQMMRPHHVADFAAAPGVSASPAVPHVPAVSAVPAVPAVSTVSPVPAVPVLPGAAEPAPARRIEAELVRPKEKAGAAAPEESGDLVRLWSPELPQTHKIPPPLRPREPEMPLPPQRRAAEPEPARTTVRIEIGRIEIRAPQQPVSTPMPPRESRESRQPQGFSLADYLRGNDGRPR